MEKDSVIHAQELVKVIFTPVINYQSSGCDYEHPHGFVYFLSEHYHRCLNRQREELKKVKNKQIFGYRYAGVDCENETGEKQVGLLIEPRGYINHFVDGHREEQSSLLLGSDEKLFYFDHPVIPDYVQIGMTIGESIKELEKKVESIRKREIEEFKNQGIETMLLDSSQISDNFF